MGFGGIPHEIYGALAAAIGLLCYVPYILSLRKGESKPHVYSWLIWGLQGLVFYFAETAAGAGPGAWISVTCGVACFGIGIAAFRYGEKNITRSDTCSFILALLAILFWAMTDNPLWAIIFACAADIFAYYPTFRKSWNKPWDENLATYEIYLLATVFGMLAVVDINATTMTGFIVLGLLAGGFSAMARWRRWVLNKKPSMEVRVA